MEKHIGAVFREQMSVSMSGIGPAGMVVERVCMEEKGRRTEDLLLDVEHFVVDAVDDLFHFDAVLLVVCPAGRLRRQSLEISLELVESLQVAGNLQTHTKQHSISVSAFSSSRPATALEMVESLPFRWMFGALRRRRA